VVSWRKKQEVVKYWAVFLPLWDEICCTFGNYKQYWMKGYDMGVWYEGNIGYSKLIRMKDLCTAVGSWLKLSSQHRMWLTWWIFPFWRLYPPQVPKAICVSRFRERFFNRRESGGVRFTTSSLCASTGLVNSKNSFDEDCLISSSVRLYTSESAATSSSDRPGYFWGIPLISEGRRGSMLRSAQAKGYGGASADTWFKTICICQKIQLKILTCQVQVKKDGRKEDTKNFTGSLLMGVLRTDPALQR